jgi:hypothetical protein
LAPPDWGAAVATEDRDGVAWDDAGDDDAGAAGDVVPSGAGVETLQAVSPASPAIATTANFFFIWTPVSP